MNKKQIFLNTISWGFALWFFGYILGIVFFPIVPKNQIGFFILPFGTALSLWILIKKIKRKEFGCYFGLGVFWVVMAIALDYFFIVKLFKSTDYYKLDVYLYYLLTFILPITVGWFKFKKK